MTEQNPVTVTLDAYASAAKAQDVDAFVALYDDDVVVYDAWGHWEHSGIAAWRAMATEWFGSLGGETVEVEFSDVRTAVGSDVAFGHATVTYVGISAEGERLRAMTNRLTVNLRKGDGGWKIVHEHTSLPVDMATGVAIFAPPQT